MNGAVPKTTTSQRPNEGAGASWHPWAEAHTLLATPEQQETRRSLLTELEAAHRNTPPVAPFARGEIERASSENLEKLNVELREYEAALDRAGRVQRALVPRIRWIDHEIFHKACALVIAGKWQMRGRRGDPEAQIIDIEPHLLRQAKQPNPVEWQKCELIINAVRWFDVQVHNGPRRPACAPAKPPELASAGRPDKRRPFDPVHARLSLMVEKSQGRFRDKVPTIQECRDFLRSMGFTGIPNDALRSVMRDEKLWPDVKPGPRRKRKTAE